MKLGFQATILILGITAVFVASASAARMMIPSHESSGFGTVVDVGLVPENDAIDAVLTALVATEAGLDEIYGAQNFAVGSFVDVSFNPIQNKLGFLGVQSQSDLLALFELGTEPSPTVNMILVDTIDWCGFPSPGIVGCARGNIMALESEAVASSMGTELIAHELGHLLGLRHVFGDPNLMTGPLNGDTSLTPGQVAIVNDSPLVQGFDPNRFVNITPVMVQQVPEPSTGALLSFVSVLLASYRRRGLL